GRITRSPDFKTSGSIFTALVPTSHRPSFVIPIGTASYFSGSSARITGAAEPSETSCSPDRPPKITPMRSLLFPLIETPLRKISIRALRSQDFLSQPGKHQFHTECRGPIGKIKHRLESYQLT